MACTVFTTGRSTMTLTAQEAPIGSCQPAAANSDRTRPRRGKQVCTEWHMPSALSSAAIVGRAGGAAGAGRAARGADAG